MKGLEHFSFEKRLRGLEKRKLKCDIINVYKYPVGRCEQDRIFSVVSSARVRGNGHVMEHKKFCLNSRKHWGWLHCPERWSPPFWRSRSKIIANHKFAGLSSKIHNRETKNFHYATTAKQEVFLVSEYV